MTLDEVDEAMSAGGSSTVLLAGGTDLLVHMRSGLSKASVVVDINYVSALTDISELQDGRVRIGAVARLSDVARHPLVRDRYHALAEAALTVGSPQIQNRATLAGNACNASPAADTSPCLLVHQAVMNVRSKNGTRTIDAVDFWKSPGKTALRTNEWIESIDLPAESNHGSSYVKLGRTRGVDLALVGAAAVVSESTALVAFASVAPTPCRAPFTESVIHGATIPDWDRVNAALARDLTPIDDLRASARYRAAMAQVCVRRALELAISRLNEDGET